MNESGIDTRDELAYELTMALKAAWFDWTTEQRKIVCAEVGLNYEQIKMMIGNRSYNDE